ncbi:hypothetical protein CVT24_012971, partial [Panaeolus cyanescens]
VQSTEGQLTVVESTNLQPTVGQIPVDCHPTGAVDRGSTDCRTNIQKICKYLKDKRIQQYHPQRENNNDCLSVCDLIQEGAAYADSLSAFRTFTHAKHQWTMEAAVAEDEDNIEGSINLGSIFEPDYEDLLMDQDEYPFQPKLDSYVLHVNNIIDEFSDSS